MFTVGQITVEEFNQKYMAARKVRYVADSVLLTVSQSINSSLAGR